jgi:hypothetical protein
MATLTISYYGSVSHGVPKDPFFSEDLSTSTETAAGSANSKGAAVASLFSDTPHYFSVGADPIASEGTGGFLPANWLIWVDLDYGQKIAAVTLS